VDFFIQNLPGVFLSYYRMKELKSKGHKQTEQQMLKNVSSKNCTRFN